MNNNAISDRIISRERLEPYLNYHKNDLSKAIAHYKSNILISESFYPLLAVLEIGLRNSIDYQLTKRFNDKEWYDNRDFVKIATRFQIDRISQARTNIYSEKKEITPGRIISELSFGFWTSLFDTKFEMTLWKNLRLAFPNCPKNIRKRKTMSAKFNGIRKLRNRIFHHEAITWNLKVLDSYKDEIIQGIEWLNEDLLEWIVELNHVDETISKFRKTID
ncbi:MAG: Abi family protein [Bacteroidetes bacterium]|nr:Abi family protein [Bacteroidota bacterium]